MQKFQKRMHKILGVVLVSIWLMLLTACSVTVSTPQISGTTPATPSTKPSTPSNPSTPSAPAEDNNGTGQDDKNDTTPKDDKTDSPNAPAENEPEQKPDEKEDENNDQTPSGPSNEAPALSVENGVLTITNPEKVTGALTLPSGNYSIPAQLFAGNENIISVVLPKGVTEIGAGAFRGCTSLTSVQLPDTLVSIGAGAFMDCTALQMVSFPAKAKLEMGSAVFSGCTELAAVDLPEGLTVLPDLTFKDCASLTQVGLPKSLESIGNGIGGVFQNCTSLKSIELPQGLKKIETYVFLNTGLVRVQIPATVETVAEGAFAQNNALNIVEFESGSTSHAIGMGVFSHCGNLETVILRGTIPELPEELFAYSSLKTLYIPASVQRIADTAFDYDAPPETIYFAGTEAAWKALTEDLWGLEEVTVRCGQPAPETSVFTAFFSLF